MSLTTLTPNPTQSNLVPRPRHWGNGALTSSAGLLAGAAATIMGNPDLTPALAAGGILAGASVIVAGHKAHRRRITEAQILEILAPMLGHKRLSAELIVTRKWVGHQPGVITLTYKSGTTVDNLLVNDLSQSLQPLLGVRYQLSSNEPRKNRLRLIRDDSQPSTDTQSADSLRLTKAVTQLMGNTATVNDVQYDDSGTVLRFVVSHEDPVRFAQSGYRTRIERTISQIFPGRWRSTWDMEADQATFEVRPTLPDSVWVPEALPTTPMADLLKNYRDVKIPYGIDEDGNEMYWQPAVVPHFLITGGTGTGKTSLAHAVLMKITQYGWPMWISDPKRVEFLTFRDWPNVQLVASTIIDQVSMIHRAHQIMEERYRLIEEEGYASEDFEPLVLFLDEYTEFRSNLIDWYNTVKVKGMPSKPPTLGLVASVIRKGRTARVHIIAATQRPDAEFLGGEMRDNFGQRAAMGRLSQTGAIMMFENSTAGVTLPRNKTGRGTTFDANNNAIEFQSYRAPAFNSSDGFQQQLNKAMRPKERHPRLVVVPIKPDVMSDDPMDPYNAVVDATLGLAADYPNLDPLQRQHLMQRPDKSSPLAVLNSKTTRTSAMSFIDEPVDPTPTIKDPFEGYDEPEVVRPSEVKIGDLIDIDGQWAVVDEEPEEDLLDDECIQLGWRSDDDDCGTLSVHSSEHISIRRPTGDTHGL